MESANWTRSQKSAARVCRSLIRKTSLRSVPPFARATMSVLFSSAWAIASRSNQPYELFSNAHLATDSRKLYAQRECCVNSFTNSIPAAAEPALLRPPAIRRLQWVETGDEAAGIANETMFNASRIQVIPGDRSRVVDAGWPSAGRAGWVEARNALSMRISVSPATRTTIIPVRTTIRMDGRILLPSNSFVFGPCDIA